MARAVQQAFQAHSTHSQSHTLAQEARLHHRPQHHQNLLHHHLQDHQTLHTSARLWFLDWLDQFLLRWPWSRNACDLESVTIVAACLQLMCVCVCVKTDAPLHTYAKGTELFRGKELVIGFTYPCTSNLSWILRIARWIACLIHSQLQSSEGVLMDLEQLCHVH